MSTITPQDLIRREVHYCVSALVHTLANGQGGNLSLRELCEQAQELSFPIEDYDEAAIEDGAKLHFNEYAGKWCVLDQPGTDLWDEFFDTEEDAARAYCEEHDIEPHEREIFEHWIVSDWFADKLAEKGEKVDKDFAGLTVWGRTTTGQAIYMDSVVQEIHAELITRSAL